MPVISTYLPGYTAVIKKDASIRVEPKLLATKIRGTDAPETWQVTGWVNGETFNGSTQWLTRWFNGRWEYTVKSNVVSGPNAPVTGYTQAQLDAAVLAMKAASDLACAGKLVLAGTAGYNEGIAAVKVAAIAVPPKV